MVFLRTSRCVGSASDGPRTSVDVDANEQTLDVVTLCMGLLGDCDYFCNTQVPNWTSLAGTLTYMCEHPY